MQRVKIYEYLRTDASVIFGVLQGSVLGSNLFIIYINDLCKIITNVDDTALVFSGATWIEVFRMLRWDFTKLAAT